MWIELCEDILQTNLLLKYNGKQCRQNCVQNALTKSYPYIYIILETELTANKLIDVLIFNNIESMVLKMICLITLNAEC